MGIFATGYFYYLIDLAPSLLKSPVLGTSEASLNNRPKGETYAKNQILSNRQALSQAIE